jgi:hypothetical protein
MKKYCNLKQIFRYHVYENEKILEFKKNINYVSLFDML